MAREYFVIDCETHPMNRAEVATKTYYHRDAKRARYSFDGCRRPIIRDQDVAFLPSTPEMPESFVEGMDASGVDMACAIPERFLFASGGAEPWCSNGWMIQACEKFPDRLIPCPNFGPIMKRPMKDVLWEMDFLAKEKGVKVFKWYCPEETYINDERLWPFYKRAEELGLVMQVHTGLGYVYGARNKYCHAGLLEDVVHDFYDLRIVAFHMGWPYHQELNVLAGAFPNLFISVSWLNCAITWRPRFFQELLGEAILYVTSDKVIWGSDFGSYTKNFVDAFTELQIDEDLQKGYGYAPLTEDDKAKILGLNMARLLGIDPTKRARRPVAGSAAT